MFSPELLDHFQHPRNAGEMPDPDATVRVENPACGDILELFASFEDGRVVNLQFRAKGCVPAMACGSAITELAKGMTFAEARAIRREEVARAVGGLPPESGHAAQLSIDAVRALLKQVAMHE